MQRPRDVDAEASLAFGAVSFRWVGDLRWLEVVQGCDHPESCLEQSLIQRLLQGAFGTGQILAEVFEVAAEVEDVEVLLVETGSEQIFSQACASTDHLPELRLGSHQLEKD